ALRDRVRMRRKQRILLIASLSALAVLGTLAIVLIYKWQQPHIRNRIISILSDNLDSSVELGDVDVALGTMVTVTAHRLVLRHREHPEAAPLVAVDRFTVEAPIVALLHTPIHIASITVVGLHISIPPRRESDSDRDAGPRSIDIAGALGRPTPVIVDRLSADDALLEIGVRKPERPPRMFRIHHVRLTGAAFDRPTHFEAELTNPTPAGLIVASGSFGPWHPYEPSLTKVE